MFSYILFDLDGTISDPKPGITKSVQYALGALGIEEPDPDRLTPFIGPPLQDSFREFYGMNEEQTERAVVKYRERFARVGLYENTLYPGMAEMLNRLRAAGCHLAVASSKPEHFVRQILDYFRIAGCFEVIVGSRPDGSGAKKEDVIRDVLGRWFGGDPKTEDTSERKGAKKEDEGTGEAGRPDGDEAFRNTSGDIIMVGDRSFDVEGARAVGLPCVGVAFGYAQPGELERSGAAYLAGTVEELERILLDGK